MIKSTIIPSEERRIPEHIRSTAPFSGAYPFSPAPVNGANGHRPLIPEYIRSFFGSNSLKRGVFRNISVHFPTVFRYPGRKTIKTEITMAGTPISMSDFKQAILLKKQGVSNRKIAAQLGINKETVNNKFAFIASRGLSFDELLKVVFHRVCLRRVHSSLYTSDDGANLMILWLIRKCPW